MGSKTSLVSCVPKDHGGQSERRKAPRIYCRLDALLPNRSKVSVDNISIGGLLFSDQSTEDLKRVLTPYSDIALSIDLRQDRERVKVRGSLVRIDSLNGLLRAAVRFDPLEEHRPLEKFLKKTISDPFSFYFLAQDFESTLIGHKLLKISKTSRMFRRIQQYLLDDAYKFQQPIDAIDGATVVMKGSKKIMMSSYSYLGLLKDPRIVSCSTEAVRKFGTGASGVRLLTGTTSLHMELEKSIAQFKNTEAAIVYSSGYLANLAIISTIVDKDDIIIVDYLAHQSIFDACRLSGAPVIKFQHNDMVDLERILRETSPSRRKLIATDAVFSMDGDIAPIPEIVRLSRKYKGIVFVDEAHAIGVLGDTGRGVDEHFHLSPDDIDIHMGTLSKAIPSSGGYVAGRSDLIYYLKHASNPFVFSAALSPAETAAALKALDIIEKEPWRIQQLRENITYFSEGLRSMGFNTMDSKSAIIPILIGDDRKTSFLSKMMNDRNVFVCPVVFPAVPMNKSRIRNCIMANHTKKQLDYVLDAYRESGKRLKII